ncbi:outer envelope pore protein 21, chloroplastic isoform X2 [Pistacia vera]|uniref:outer envelope pore protein 21, chloroplastic isoform X2 n=1 Tax=Pistacia vera TaxID=55513 RepID=UPI001263C17D|nr:outer envelope pore protein 21, chloroplastic isoform X2 [Pistacia vera]
METSLRYGKDSKALRIHAKEKFLIDSNTRLQLSASLGVGLQYTKHEKLRYFVRAKKGFPVTSNGLLSFNIKGRCDVDKEFKQKNSKGAAEFSWSIFNFQREQDIRFKLGYEVIDKVPYFQIRENNWTLNADMNGRWNVRYDL